MLLLPDIDVVSLYSGPIHLTVLTVKDGAGLRCCLERNSLSGCGAQVTFNLALAMQNRD